MARVVLAELDKVVLGAAMIGLVFCAKGAVSDPPGVEVARELASSVQVLDAHASARAVAPAPAPAWVDEARAGLAAEGVPAAADWPAWSTTARPYLLFDTVPPPQPPAFVHEAALDVKAVCTEPGTVVVRWTPGRVEELLVTYTVERRRGDEAWTAVGTVAAPGQELVDAGVAPRARYAYRVVGEAAVDEEDFRVKRAREAGTFTGLDGALARVVSEPSAEVATPTDLYVFPRSVSDGTAHGEVLRWDAGTRGWARARFGGKVGGQVAPGLALEEAGVDGGRLWVKVRVVATGEVLEEDSRRDRLPPEARSPR